MMDSMLHESNSDAKHVGPSCVAPETEDGNRTEEGTITAQELRDIWSWNAIVPETVEACMHDLIAKTTSRQPKAQAVCAWDGRLTYGQLDILSTRLAHYLVGLGVGPEVIVPLCFEKSMWTPVAMLAVMKAGGASVALDSSQPEERLRTIVQQVKPVLILSSSANRELAGQLTRRQVVVVDDAHLVGLEASATGLALPASQPRNKLYIAFTSGSTGTPKGVIITHSNFSSVIRYQQELLRIVATTRVYDVVPYAFDVAWSNLLHALSAGACICIPSDGDRLNDIAGSMRRLQANYIHLTPTVARLLNPAEISGLKTLAFTGEKIKRADVAPWPAQVMLLNTYGPTECSVTSTIEVIMRTTSSEESRIGKGIGLNTWVVRTGTEGGLSRIGSVGELWLEGPLVGSGYLFDEEKTAATFIKDPPWLLQGGPGNPGRRGRLYKTGDLVRYNSDGTLTFVGRKDTQVKVRGQRVELSEVEHHVHRSLGDDVDAQVIAEVITPRKSSNAILVVFLCFREAENPQDKGSLAAVRKRMSRAEEKLAAQLPAYLIPSAYLPLPNVPMTATGKTNRRRLREIGESLTLEQLALLNPLVGERRRPNNPGERRIQHLWAAVLHIDPEIISADDSFLRIGGDSIAAMRLVRAARDQGLSLTVADVFKHPRLSNLANFVKDAVAPDGDHAQPAALSLLRVQDPTAFLQDLVVPQINQDLSMVEDILPTTDFQNLALEDNLCDPPNRWTYWILDMPGDVDFDRLDWACSTLIKHFDILRTVFILAKAEYWQVVLRSMKPRFDLMETDTDAMSFANKICEEDLKLERIFGRSFLRFVAIKGVQGDNKLIFRLSHAQYDGFSFQRMFERLSSIYNGVDDVPNAASFGHFISYIASQKAKSIEYWKSRLLGSPTPTRSDALAGEGELISSARINRKCTLKMPSCPHGVSSATLFHAACAVTLSQLLNQPEVILGRLVTGRSMLPPKLQAVMGPCIGEIPIRIRIHEGDTVSAVATQLQEQFIEDAAFESVGMVEIIRHCTDWPEEVHDFGWRTVFQFEGESDSNLAFSGEQCGFSAYEREESPRWRSEIRAHPLAGEIQLEFEGNKRLICDAGVDTVLARLQAVLKHC